MFELKAGNFYIALAGEADRVRVLKIIRDYMKPDQRIFIGVVSPIDPRIETAEEIRDRILEAAKYIPSRTTGHHGRLRILAFQRRHFHEPRHGLCENPRAGARHRARGRSNRTLMADDNEEKQLRSVLLQTANTILLARQRAEQELIQAKEALERKTEELAHSLAMMRATLESTTNGILVTDAHGNVTDFNQNFVDMWQLPREMMETAQHRATA